MNTYKKKSTTDTQVSFNKLLHGVNVNFDKVAQLNNRLSALKTLFVS